jgi:tetratricopeptide (TPR) repeat protein
MAPAMMLSARARARGETSRKFFFRSGENVAMCNLDDEGLVLQRKMYREEIQALEAMTPQQRKRLRLELRDDGICAVSDDTPRPRANRVLNALRGGSSVSPALLNESLDDIHASTAKRPRTSAARTHAGAASEGSGEVGSLAAGGEGGERQDGHAAGLGEELDVKNETALEIAFNSAADCDALEAMYARVLAVDPSHVTTLQHYGNLLMRLRKNYTGAEAMYSRVLSVVPDHVPALCNYGNLLHNHLGEWNKAETVYKRALALQPNHTTTLSNYGLFLQNVKGDLAAAALQVFLSLSLSLSLSLTHYIYIHSLSLSLSRHTHTHTYTHTYAHTHTRTHTHTHTHTHTRTHTHTCIYIA